MTKIILKEVVKDLRTLRGKQYRQRKFKYTWKVWISKFLKSMYLKLVFLRGTSDLSWFPDCSKQFIVFDASVLYSLFLIT